MDLFSQGHFSEALSHCRRMRPIVESSMTSFSKNDLPPKPDSFCIVDLLKSNAPMDCLFLSHSWLDLISVELLIWIVGFGQGNTSRDLVREAFREVESYPIPYSEMLMETDFFRWILRLGYLLPETQEESLRWAHILKAHFPDEISLETIDRIKERKNYMGKYQKDWRAFQLFESTLVAGGFRDHEKKEKKECVGTALAICDSILTAYEKEQLNFSNENYWRETLTAMMSWTTRLIEIHDIVATDNSDYVMTLNGILERPVFHILLFSSKGFIKAFIKKLKNIPRIKEVDNFRLLETTLAEYPSFWQRLFSKTK